MKTVLVAALLLPLALVAGGCSGAPTSAEPAPGASSTAAPAAPATEGVISPADLAAEPEFTNKAQGVIGDVEVESCGTGADTTLLSPSASEPCKSARLSAAASGVW